MGTEPLNYETLRRRQQLERSSPRLTKLDADFYQNLELHLQGMQEELARENQRNAGGTKATLLTDELKNIRNLADDLYENRQRKIVLAALGASREGNPDRAHMLAEEAQLFEGVLALMRDTKRRVLHGRARAAAAVAAPLPASAPSAAPSPSPPPTPTLLTEGGRVLVRVLEDLGAFAASDLRTYHVQRDDVVDLPSDTAKILIQRGKAVEVTAA